MITLTKEDGPADLDGVTHLEIGASWDPTVGSSGGFIGKLRQKAGTDLDLIAIAMQGQDPVHVAGELERGDLILFREQGQICREQALHLQP